MKWIKKSIEENRRITLEDVIERNGSTYSLLLDFKNTPQDKEWHAEGDVHIHTNMVMNETYNLFQKHDFSLTDKYILLMAAIFHDIAKPLVTREKEINGQVRVIAPQHEQKGMSYLFYKFLEEEMTQDEMTHILNLVGYHQKPKFLVFKEQNEWQYKALMSETAGYLFYYHEIADIKGRTSKDEKEQLSILEEFRMFCEEYDCFDKNSDLKTDVRNIFSAEFNETVEDYRINKTCTDLINNEYDTPFVGYSRHYSKKDNNGKLFLLCGLSGSGKSTVVKSLKDKHSIDNVIALDEIRKQHKINNTNRKQVEGRVMQEAKTLLKEYLAKGENVIWDACNIRKDFRKIIIDMANDYHAETTLVFVQTPISKCIEQDKNRDAFIGDTIIREQERKFQYPERNETDNYIILRH